MAVFKSIPIGKVLQEYGYVSETQIEEALAYQREHKDKRLGEILLEQGYVTETQVLDALSMKLNLTIINIAEIRVDEEAVSVIPSQLAEKYLALGIKLKDNILTVAVNDPLNFYGLEDIRQFTGYDIQLVLCEKQPLSKAISYYYSELSAKKAANKVNTSLEGVSGYDDEIIDEDEEAPVIELLNTLIQRAYLNQGSDIHIEPFEHETIVRMRIDGVIVDFVKIAKAMHTSLIARIKILANLDIAERRIPQDGHFKMKIDGDDVNLRVSVLPTVFGEKAVLRLLSSNVTIVNRGTFGMNKNNYDRFKDILQSPNGILYITGPTGSGKSTTLYMVLSELSEKQINVSTIEDPVEKNLPRVNQTQVNEQAGMTFEVGLRALLRQDPDVIMIGETRDAETASISIRAAITGHFVLSTLHTNSAAATIARLIDMGMEPYMISSSVVGVVAQRLMRRLCPHCKQLTQMDENQVHLIGKKFPIYKPVGCVQCNNTGYRGRIAIHEVLGIDYEAKKMISRRASTEDIQAYAMKNQGMTTLKQEAIALLEQGVTSYEETIKIAYTVD